MIYMKRFFVIFTDDRKDSKTYRQNITTYTVSAHVDSEAIESASIKFYKDHLDFDPTLNQILAHSKKAIEIESPLKSKNPPF